MVGKKLEAVMMTASVGLVMLLSPQRIVITRRKALLQVLLYVVLCSHLFEEIDHPQCVIAPIGRLGHWQVINAAHLVEVNKGVCVSDLPGWTRHQELARD